jgi:replication factor A1
VKPFSSITTKTGNQLAKREVDIVDDSHRGIQLTLWGDRAEQFSGERNQVLAIKAAKISEYGGQKNLSALQSSVIELNPDNERAIGLRTWIDTTDQASLRSMLPTGSAGGGASRSYPDHTLAEVSGMNIYGKAEYMSVRATIMAIKTDKTVFYKSCPGNNCMRRVSGEDGSYTCDRCNKTYDRCNMRYVVSLSIADDTGSQWVSAFNDAAATIFNVEANDMSYRRETDPARFDATVEAARYNTFNFRASISQEEWEGQSRLRMKLLSAHAVDYVAESRKLVAKIRALQGVQ